METQDKHHTNKGRGLIKHFPDTCNVYGIRKQDVLYTDPHDNHRTSFGLPTEVRIVPSSKGIVAVLYFDQMENSHIVFITQIAPKRGAWQNLSWEPNFHRNWDEKRIKESVNHFLEVAERENLK